MTIHPGIKIKMLENLYTKNNFVMIGKKESEYSFCKTNGRWGLLIIVLTEGCLKMIKAMRMISVI